MSLRHTVLLKRNAGLLCDRVRLIDIAMEGARHAGTTYMFEESDVTGLACPVVAINNRDIALTKLKWFFRSKGVYSFDFTDRTQSQGACCALGECGSRKRTGCFGQLTVGFLLAKFCELRDVIVSKLRLLK